MGFLILLATRHSRKKKDLREEDMVVTATAIEEVATEAEEVEEVVSTKTLGQTIIGGETRRHLVRCCAVRSLTDPDPRLPNTTNQEATIKLEEVTKPEVATSKMSPIMKGETTMDIKTIATLKTSH